MPTPRDNFSVILPLLALGFALLKSGTAQAENQPIEASPATEIGCKEGIEDFINFVSGGKECLGLKTSLGSNPEDGRLIVYLHGDNPGGHPVDGMCDSFVGRGRRTDAQFSEITTICIARPGHRFNGGKESTGTSCTLDICYYAHNMDAMADAIGRLKLHYSASTLILVGYSGGGNNAASIAGRKPELGIDHVISISGSLDFDKWVQTSNIMRSNWRIFPSPSAVDFIDRISPDTEFSIISGADDRNVREEVADSFIQKAEARGLRVKKYVVPSGHWGQMNTPEYAAIIQSVMAKTRDIASARRQKSSAETVMSQGKINGGAKN